MALDGTSEKERMESDIEELKRCRDWIESTEHKCLWLKLLSEFRILID